MDEVLYITVASETYDKHNPIPIITYEHWWMIVKVLLREAKYAREKGQTEKAHNLLLEALKTARGFHLYLN